jgi:cytosine/adenosine deaminase-related metal-dependent hydrolase
MRILLATLPVFATAACVTATDTSTPLTGEPDLVIRNVTVIDPARSSRETSRDVIIDNGRIVAVRTSGQRAPNADRTIDGTGQFLMPGLMDMHVHVNLRPIHHSTLALLLANGVTGVRDMGSDCQRPGGITMCIDEVQATAAAIENGEVTGPRLLQLSSSKISSIGRPDDAAELARLHYPQNEAEGATTARGLIARGAGILKIGDYVEGGAYREIIREARTAGVRVGGHIPIQMSVAQAVEAGQETIEHARDLPLDCSTGGSGYRTDAAAAVIAGNRPAGSASRASIAVSSHSPELCAQQINAMVRSAAYYVPTHLTRELDYRAGDPAYRNDPLRAYVPPMQWRMWERDLDRSARATPEDVAMLERFFRLGLTLTGQAHRAGVRIMAGTDANDTMVVPGFSLHRELGFLVDAGLSPMAALQSATSVPAQYLGRSNMYGGVQRGMMADLLLLRADPMADIANTRSIVAVIQNGRVRDRVALDALLEQARLAAAAAPSPRQ